MGRGRRYGPGASPPATRGAARRATAHAARACRRSRGNRCLRTDDSAELATRDHSGNTATRLIGSIPSRWRTDRDRCCAPDASRRVARGGPPRMTAPSAPASDQWLRRTRRSGAARTQDTLARAALGASRRRATHGRTPRSATTPSDVTPERRVVGLPGRELPHRAGRSRWAPGSTGQLSSLS
jgi:hypothetical protein